MAYAQTLKVAGAIMPPLLALGAVLVVAAVAFSPSGFDWRRKDIPVAETVRVPPATIAYRAAGTFVLDGNEIDAPLTEIGAGGALDVMKYQVSVGQYALCVADGACVPADTPHGAGGDMPVTGVSYVDAVAYAQWFSQASGERWRLPTDLEWARFADLAPEPELEAGSQNMVDRWLDSYRREAASDRAPDPAVKPKGHFGVNALGIADIAGNVWEWTDTCFARIGLDAAGNIASRLETCGVRVAQGQHRAYLSVFVRNPVTGACAVGTPPDHLGFRLVREPAWYENLLRWFD